MQKPKTSRSHPLQINSVETPVGGFIGMTFCPGKKQLGAVSGYWDRDIDIDLDAVKAWGAVAVVTLMEEDELAHYKVPGMADCVVRRRMGWWHLPIQDAGVPCATFEARWVYAGAVVRYHLAAGQRVLLHCRGGLGRTGMIAARLLIELGESVDEAIERVRRARPGTIENRAQELHLRAAARPAPEIQAGRLNILDWHDSELAQLFVAPFYLSLLHANFLSSEKGNERFVPHLRLASRTISDRQLTCLLDLDNWRPCLMAGWLVGLGRRAALTGRLSNLLSTAEGGYADQGYAVGLGLLGGDQCRDALTSYLRKTLSARCTWSHSAWAMGALAHVDRGAAREFMDPGLWSHLDGQGESAEKAIQRFSEVVAFARRNRLSTES